MARRQAKQESIVLLPDQTSIQRETADDALENRNCFSRLITFAGWAFSVLTVVINLSDVTTDVIVAVQFHRDGDTVWFWLVVAFLALAHMVYALVATIALRDQNAWQAIGWGRLPHAVRFGVSLLIAQFVPLINLVLETKYRNEFSDDDFSSRQLSDTLFNDTVAESRAVRQEMSEIERSRELQRRVAAAIDEHMSKYGMFYIESGVEAAPQAVIQLLAITFLGRASPVQLVSLCCSLFSITSKGFIISQSYDARVMVFKFALVAHDVFSTFYLFSTIVAAETIKDTDFFGLRVSWLGYIWLWKMVVCAGLAFTAGVIGLIWAAFSSDVSGRDMRDTVLGFFSSIALAGPLALGFETCKLSWIICCMTYDQPRQSSFTMYSLLLSFLSRDDSQNSRLRHLVTFTVDAFDQEKSASMKSLRAKKMRPVRSLKRVRAAAANTASKFDLWALRRHMSKPKSMDDAVCPSARTFKWKLLPLLVGVSILSLATFLGQMFSLCYPFVNAAFQFKTHNLLQATCFYATCSALFIALCTLSRAYLYWVLNVKIKRFYNAVGTEFQRLDQLAKMIAKYHEPPFAEALEEIVPVEVLPLEVTHFIASSFLTADDLGMKELTIEECKEIKWRVAARRQQLSSTREGDIEAEGDDRDADDSFDDDE